jgi:hypothetical protein
MKASEAADSTFFFSTKLIFHVVYGIIPIEKKKFVIPASFIEQNKPLFIN